MYIDIFAANMRVAFAMQVAFATLVQQKISMFLTIFQDRNFNVRLASTLLSFEQLGHGL